MTAASGSEDFTVLMAVYDGDDVALFRRAVDSVYANTRPPADFVLVVDGPVREELTAEIAGCRETYDLRVVQLSQNAGLAAALNKGLEHIETEWTVRADADDFNLPDRFERQMKFLAQHGGAFDAFGGAIQEMDETGVLGGTRRLPETGEQIARFARTRNPLNHMTVCFRTDLVRRHGGYPPVYLREDYALWIRLIAAGARLANMPEVLVHAHAGLGMIKRRGGLKYALGEIELQRLLVTLGLKSPVRGLIDGTMRSAIFLSPGPIRNRVYARLLRS